MASLHPTMVLESRVMLRATLPRINGQRVESEIDLNTIIGNQNGSFCWGSSGFMSSARNITLFFDEYNHHVVLRATLENVFGEGFDASINLDQQIFIVDGSFHCAPTPQSCVLRLWAAV